MPPQVLARRALLPCAALGAVGHFTSSSSPEGDDVAPVVNSVLAVDSDVWDLDPLRINAWVSILDRHNDRDPREPEDTFLDHGFADHGFGRLPRYPTWSHTLGLAQFHLCYIGGFFCSFVSFVRARDGTNRSAAPPVGLLAS
jgi:hypothetical protein